MKAKPAAGSSVQPCRSASSIACLPRSAARGNEPVELDLRPVHQAHELQIGPPDPARQRDPLFQVRLGLLERPAQVSLSPILTSANARSSSPPARAAGARS